MPVAIFILFNFPWLALSFTGLNFPQENGFTHARAITIEQLPPAIIQDIERGMFKTWVITEVYENQNTQVVPGDFIVKIEKRGTFMYLFYTENGERIINYQ